MGLQAIYVDGSLSSRVFLADALDWRRPRQ